jgi:hypothetical protein
MRRAWFKNICTAPLLILFAFLMASLHRPTKEIVNKIIKKTTKIVTCINSQRNCRGKKTPNSSNN